MYTYLTRVTLCSISASSTQIRLNRLLLPLPHLPHMVCRHRLVGKPHSRFGGRRRHDETAKQCVKLSVIGSYLSSFAAPAAAPAATALRFVRAPFRSLLFGIALAAVQLSNLSNIQAQSCCVTAPLCRQRLRVSLQPR
jgi:hypothetical protein